jgi:hypothetical protein
VANLRHAGEEGIPRQHDVAITFLCCTASLCHPANCRWKFSFSHESFLSQTEFWAVAMRKPSGVPLTRKSLDLQLSILSKAARLQVSH